MSKHTYFYPVKKHHLTAVQQLWDSIRAGEKITSFFPKFKRDITRAGELNLPLERQVRAWAKDVAAGIIPRPSAAGESYPDFAPPLQLNIVGNVSEEALTEIRDACRKAIGRIIHLRSETDQPEVIALRSTSEPAEPTETVVHLTEQEIDELVEANNLELQWDANGVSPPAVPLRQDDEQAAIAEANNMWRSAEAASSFVVDTMILNRTDPSLSETSEAEDPVKDAIDIIVDHYQQKAFAKARKEAAADAARALRFFADKVEASA